MSVRPAFTTRGLSSLSQSQSASDSNSPVVVLADRDDARRNMLKAMRLPTQHYWHVWFDRQPVWIGQAKHARPPAKNAAAPSHSAAAAQTEDPSAVAPYQSHLEQLGEQIESVSDFWRYHNNTPVDKMRMRESIYLFKAGFRPVWEDRRNVLGGSWTFRVPRAQGPDLWTRVQLLALGERLQDAVDAVGQGDQVCGVGLSVRFNSHLISVWNRDAASERSVNALRDVVLADLPADFPLRPDAYFYKPHADHPGFCPSQELRVVIDSRRRAATAAVTAVPADSVDRQD